MKGLTSGNVVYVVSFVPEVCVFTHRKFYHAYDSIICFEDTIVRFGIGRKAVFEGINCRTHFLLSSLYEIYVTFLGNYDFPGKIVFTTMTSQNSLQYFMLKLLIMCSVVFEGCCVHLIGLWDLSSVNLRGVVLAMCTDTGYLVMMW
jgi:hypothetical protein